MNKPYEKPAVVSYTETELLESVEVLGGTGGGLP